MLKRMLQPLARRQLKPCLISCLIIWMYVTSHFFSLQTSYRDQENEEADYDSIQKDIYKPAANPDLLDTHTATVPNNISLLLPHNDSLCELMDPNSPANSVCNNKINWMKSFWRTDACYADLGVDGSLCSIRYYLSQVENYCPPMQWMLKPQTQPPNSRRVPALFNTNPTRLSALMSESKSAGNYEWMVRRIMRLWPFWTDALGNLKRLERTSRTQKRILIYLGFLSKKSGFRIQQSASAGGPLGEMVQWSDILSALHLLGHQLTITSEYDELTSKLSSLPNMKSQCQVSKSILYDVIITDITGLAHFKKHVGQGYAKFSCMLWIIDSFGTEAAFNHRTYYLKNRAYKSNWGKHELKLKQFFTMFPHSPDNSFMGFVVEQHHSHNDTLAVARKQQAVVYGKSQYMWNGKEKYLETISKYVKIHGTVFTDGTPSILPPFVFNHGILSGVDLQRLLLESKLFIGLGFPYEGPGPLEAVAAGCVFINPRFDPPHNAANTLFFKGKPTMRGLSSQHPYAEDFISHPNVLTVDMGNLSEVDVVVRQALRMFDNASVQGYLPREFTHEGMLERVNAYLEHQDFCRRDTPWPPVSAVKFLVSRDNHSCKQTCWKHKLLCEPSHFERLNAEEELRKHFSCRQTVSRADLVFPAFEHSSSTCVLQQDSLLFSCVDRSAGFQRLCPCRTFIKGQQALCPECL